MPPEIVDLVAKPHLLIVVLLVGAFAGVAGFNHSYALPLVFPTERAMSPQGFNIGINIGRCAGAGLPGHLHQHVVPRWNGDTNFMGVVGEVRVVPQAMSQLYDELMRVRGEMGTTNDQAPMTNQ